MNEKRPLLSERSVDLDEAPDVTEDSARDLRSSSSNVADRDHGYNLARVKALLYKSRYYVPVVMWLPNYDWRRNLGPDVLAGLCVSAILIPQAISYALIVGIPPIYGMYTAFYPALVYFFMGQSMQLSMGPDAVVSIMVGVVVEESELDPLVFVQLLAFGIGVFVLALGLMRLGFLDVILSRPLLAGFINAVALEIILNQLDTLFGVPNRKIQGWHKLEWLFANFDKVRPLAIAVGCACIAALLAFKFVKMMAKKRWPRAVLFPDMLLVVGTVIAIVKVQGLNETHGLDLLGDIGSGLVAPSIPQFEYFADDVDEFTRTVLVVGLLGFIESIVCCKVYALRHSYDVSPNREMVAYGLANMVGSFFGCYPAFGSFTRSSLADSAGAKSLVYSAVTLIIIVLALYLLGPMFAYMPKVVGSAVIFVAALNIFELHDIKFLWEMRSYAGLALCAATFVMTIVIGLELGIILSLVMSLFLLLKRVSKTSVISLGLIRSPDGSNHYKDVTQYVNAELIPGIAILRLGDTLFFGNVNSVISNIRRIERFGALHAHPSAKPVTKRADGVALRAVILHFGAVEVVDESALQALRELADDLESRNVALCFVKISDQLKRMFMSAHIITKLQVFPDVQSAVDFVTNGAQSASFYSSHLRARALMSSTGDVDIDDGTRLADMQHLPVNRSEPKID